MTWVLIVAAIVLAGGLAFWWLRRRKRSRLVSIVALLREPVEFDPAVLARAAGKAWNADLGDGDSEGADGFVAAAGVVNTIVHDGRMFLINNFDRPYVDNPDQVAAGFQDHRIAELFRQHQAWFSCDALGVDRSTPENEIRDWYRRIGRLLAELVDENCLLLYLPDLQLSYPINEQTKTSLQSSDPIAALQGTLTAPMYQVSGDNPELHQAVETARRTWPEFVAAFEARAGLSFSVKAPITHSGNTEFIWVAVTALEGETIYGELANDPVNLGPLRAGSKVTVTLADMNDWVYRNSQGTLVGGFTIEVVQKASRQRR